MIETAEPACPAVHWENPWTEAIPVPLEELAVCVAGGTIGTPDGTKDYTVEYVLESWRRFGDRLDGYLLVGGDRFHSSLLAGHISVGVRYGAEGEKYLSPPCRNVEVARALIGRYGPKAGRVAEDDETAPFAP